MYYSTVSKVHQSILEINWRALWDRFIFTDLEPCGICNRFEHKNQKARRAGTLSHGSHHYTLWKYIAGSHKMGGGIFQRIGSFVG
jgi:hypothetical protein